MLIGGKWDASVPATLTTIDAEGSNSLSSSLQLKPSPIQLLKDMIVGGAIYIKSSKFWPIVFIKLTGSIIYGGADVLNVSFSEEVEDENGHLYVDENDKSGNSERLGALFFCVGFGCLIGPIISDYWTSMKNHMSILNACVIAFAVEAIGCLGMGYFQPFYLACVFTVIRAAGSSIAWIDSSVLLQVCTIY